MDLPKITQKLSLNMFDFNEIMYSVSYSNKSYKVWNSENTDDGNLLKY